MKTLARVGAAVVAALVGGGILVTSSNAASLTRYDDFKAEGTVGAIRTGVNNSFDIAPPINNFGNQAIMNGANPDGSLSIQTKFDTKYFRYDSVKAKYVGGTFADTVVLGEPVRAAGRYTQVGSSYTFTADKVWQPPKTTGSAPPNPPCDIPQDFLFKRHFNIKGSVHQTGYNLTNLGIYSDFFGFSLFPVTASAPAHAGNVIAHDSGVMGANVILTGEQNTIAGYIAPTTRYRKQNPDTLKWEESTKDDTIMRGGPVQVTGHYGCMFADWRFLAQKVW